MELRAPSHWRCIDIISDLHLQVGDQRTYAAWTDYLRHTRADAVLILGDLFEVWVGDDALQEPASFEAQCAAALRQAGLRLALYIMQGNRDFLMGPALMAACHATALPDPSVLCVGGERWMLSHGDALCLDDRDYQVFRREVRSSAWQQDFLAKPLSERQAIARGIRQQSESRKRSAAPYADVDSAAALALLTQHQSVHLIHGHTHRPAEHLLAPQIRRSVLSDWDTAATPVRGEVLRLTLSKSGSATLARLPAALIASSVD